MPDKPTELREIVDWSMITTGGPAVGGRGRVQPPRPAARQYVSRYHFADHWDNETRAAVLMAIAALL